MNGEKKQEQRHTHDPVDRVFQTLREYFHEYGRIALGACLAAVLLVVGIQLYQGRHTAEDSGTWSSLSTLDKYTYGSAMQQNSNQGQALSEVIKSCEEILDKRWETSATPWVWLKLANARSEAGRMTEAVAAYRTLMEKYPKSEAARMAEPALAGTLEEMGRYEEAAAEYEKLAEKRDRPDLWLDVARAYQLAGDFPKAQTYYERAKEEAGSENQQVAKLAEFGIKAAAGGKKLTVPDKPTPEQGQAPGGQQGAAPGSALTPRLNAGNGSPIEITPQKPETEPTKDAAPEQKTTDSDSQDSTDTSTQNGE